MDTILLDVFGQLLSAILDGLSNAGHHFPVVGTGGGGDEVTKFIDKWAGVLINNLGTFTKETLLKADAVGLARTILSIGILFVLGYEMWPVIQGKRSPDITVLLKPFLLFGVITGWTGFVNGMMKPGELMTSGGRTFYETQWQKMGSLEDSCRVMQTRIDSLRNVQVAEALAELEGDKEMVKQESEEPGSMEEVTGEEEHDTSWLGEKIEALKEAITSKFKALWTVIKDQLENVFKSLMEWLTGWFEKIVKWISCLYLQMNFYGIMMVGQIGMGVLALRVPGLSGDGIYLRHRLLRDGEIRGHAQQHQDGGGPGGKGRHLGRAVTELRRAAQLGGGPVDGRILHEVRAGTGGSDIQRAGQRRCGIGRGRPQGRREVDRQRGEVTGLQGFPFPLAVKCSLYTFP